MDEQLQVQENQDELRRLKKLQVLQKLFFFLLLERKKHWFILFLLALSIGLTIRYALYPIAPFRYHGEVTLFYTPRGNEEVKSLSLSHILEIFCRKQALQQLIDELALSPKEQKKLTQNLEVKLVRDQPNMFKIYGKGPSEDFVKKTVNTFADIGIRNYRDYRTNELNAYLDDRLKLRGELLQRRQELISQEDNLYSTYAIIQPHEEIERINKLNAEYRTKLADLNVKLSDAQQAFAIQDKSFRTIPLTVIQNRHTLKRLCEEIHRRQQALEDIRLIFIDRNPRVKERQDSYDQARRNLEDFQRKMNIPQFHEDMLIGINELVDAHTAATVKLDIVKQHVRTVQQEIKRCEEIQLHLQQMIPTYNSLMHARDTLNKTLGQVNEEIIRIRGSISHVNSDLTLNERLFGASGDKIYPMKMLAVIVILAIVATLGIATIITLYDMLYGTVSCLEEMALFKDYLPLLGVVPRADLAMTDEQKDTLVNSIYYNTSLTFRNLHTVFAGSLDGTSKSSRTFCEGFAAIHGESIPLTLLPSVKLELLKPQLIHYGHFYFSNHDYSHCSYTELMQLKENIAMKEQEQRACHLPKLGDQNIRAFFPINNLNVLSPQETDDLEAALHELQQFYQLIIVTREVDFKNPCMFLKQMLDLCDVTIIFVSKRMTHRKIIWKILDLTPEEHRILAVMTEVTQLEKLVKGEYF